MHSEAKHVESVTKAVEVALGHEKGPNHQRAALKAAARQTADNLVAAVKKLGDDAVADVDALADLLGLSK